MTDNRYSVDYAKRAAGCKKCKGKIEKTELRIAKITANPFNDEGDMKLYHHPHCIFETFKRARSTTKIIEEPGDLEGWEDIKDEDKELIKKLIKEHQKKPESTTPKKRKADDDDDSSFSKKAKTEPQRARVGDPGHKDNSFREFRRICLKIAEESSYLAKTEIVRQFFEKGTDSEEFKGDLHVWVRLLLPGVVKRIYNLQSKQLIKIFSRIFGTNEEEMLTDLEDGDVAQTIATFFEKSPKIRGREKSDLNVFEVDDFLENLQRITLEDKHQYELEKIVKRCTINDLKMIVRLIKGDLRIQAGAKHILDALHPEAHEAFNSSRNIEKVLDKIQELGRKRIGFLDVGATLMQPVQPMLARPCKSVDMAFEKCPNGMYSEIKYDGERVQLHKRGSEFKYYSRSLKPVMPHKVRHFEKFIPEAFPGGSNMILDAEVLLVDNKTGIPLPFGTLGVHKAAGFTDATPCLFVFDIIYYNGENLMGKPIKERRKLLTKSMVEVGNNVKFSEMKLITKKSELSAMINEVFSKGLEGLVLKDLMSVYEPGKRHWLKVKKDYLNEGAMADSADLLVLGGWFGTGNRGGFISIFLMGCLDKRANKWCTVTKVHTGHDDATLERLQKELLPNMDKIKQVCDNVPNWLNCTRNMTPDFVAKDPKIMPIWEITGAEFTKSDIHTANGISIRFPRVTKIRDDKNWKTGTSLEELEELYKTSKEHIDIKLEYSKDDDENEIIVDKEAAQLEEVKTFSTLGKSGRSYDKIRIKTESGMELNLIQGDLFSVKVSLAHCISLDYKLGKGIAKIFREKFGRISGLGSSEAEVGGIAVLKDSDRFIYNLVTKVKYNDQPTYEDLRKSLEAMKVHALSHEVTEIAMPLIGCDLDGLRWNVVRTILKNVFLRTKIKLSVYCLNKTEISNFENGAAIKKESSTENSIPIKKESSNSSTDESKKNETSSSSTQESYNDSIKMENSVQEVNSVKKRMKFPRKQMTVSEMFGTEIASDNGINEKKEEEEESVLRKLRKIEVEDFPDTFIGTKIIIKNGVEDREKLRRYVIAFGGEVVEDQIEVDKATYVVYSLRGKLEKKIKSDVSHVNELWLVNSIISKHIQNTKSYKINK